MIEHAPDLDCLIDGQLHGSERDRFARTHDVLVTR